jgi:class 3 adenylate cyclase
MARRVRLRLRTKLFLALGALACLSLALALAVVRDVTGRRLREGFAERFTRARAAFGELEALRVDAVREEIEALCYSHPQLRPVLSTASVADEDLGFGDPTDAAEPLRDAHLRLLSLLPSVPLAQRSDLFLVASRDAELVYSKTDPDRFGTDLGADAFVQGVLENGGRVGVRVRDGGGAADAELLPAAPDPAVYLVVGERVVFDDEVHGAVIAGRRLGADLLRRLREISGLDVALVAGDAVVVSTLADGAARALGERLGALPAPSGPEPGSAAELELGGERFLAAHAEVVSGSSDAGARFVLLGSLEADLARLAAVERSLAAIGGLVLAVAVGVAFALARGMTRPVAVLGEAARRVGAGELDVAVDVRTGDELEELGAAFGRMVAGLRERDRIRRSFERHVSPAVAAAILRDPGLAPTAGERREVTFLFVDVGGFSSLAESATPERVVALLNEYFDAVCAIVFETGGTVNELRGDGILAFWGAPVELPDHAARACEAALRCRDRLARLDAEWVARGLSPRRFRIGLHTGEVVVGEIGTRERAKYGAVGDAVNLASRLEAANKTYGTSILVSEATRVRAGDAFATRELDRVRVAGRETPVRIFELAGRASSVPEALSARQRRFEAALASYRARDFAGALAALRELWAEDPDDIPTRDLLARAELCCASPPPPEWDAVHELDAKGAGWPEAARSR